MHTGLRWGHMTERGHSEDPGVDVKMVVKYIFKKWDGRDSINLVQERDKCGALFNTAMDFRFPKTHGIILRS